MSADSGRVCDVGVGELDVIVWFVRDTEAEWGGTGFLHGFSSPSFGSSLNSSCIHGHGSTAIACSCFG